MRKSIALFSASLIGALVLCSLSLASAQDANKGDAKTSGAVGSSAEVAPEGYREIPCAEAPEGMSCVPGGAFLRGHDSKDKNARPQQKIWLTTFYIDRHEVTNAAYKACIKAGKCNEAGPRYRGYDDDAQPITGVSWFDARKFCEAQGKQLPTESQWEKAARGPDGEINPWGDEPATCDRAVIMNDKGRACGVQKPGSKPEAGRIWKVGQKPAGRYGLHDMSGNAEEWTLDWYTSDWEACGESCQGLDPKGPCDGAKSCKGFNKRVLRGGSWYWPGENATGIHRRANVPSNRPYHHFGFRCAASVEQAAALVKGGKVK